jgi:tetratricopeptide (TPR) repeat protein
LEQALRLSKQADLKLQIAVQTDNLGLAYDTIADQPTALKYHQQAAALIEDLNNPHWASIIKINCANTHLKLNAVDLARPLFIQALAEGREHANTEVIVRALIGHARLALLDADPQAADEMLDEALQLARQADLRRYLAEALQVQSEQQAALHETERSLTLWDEAQKLFSVLQMPQAELEPDWLKDHPVES